MTWNAFIRQFEATGRNKADGYFPFHFDGMGAEELDRARRMMEARGVGGDTTDLDGLRLIGDPDTSAALVSAQTRDGTLGLAFEVARRETLFALTRDARHLEPLVASIDAPDAQGAAFAAQALARHELPPTFAPALAERIVDGRHEAALPWIVQAWLSARGLAIRLTPVFDGQLPFIRCVTQSSPAGRAPLLAAWTTTPDRS